MTIVEIKIEENYIYQKEVSILHELFACWLILQGVLTSDDFFFKIPGVKKFGSRLGLTF